MVLKLRHCFLAGFPGPAAFKYRRKWALEKPSEYLLRVKLLKTNEIKIRISSAKTPGCLQYIYVREEM
jgi:hypothetical protein